jgi:23S rRNA (guanosine2251-2'-O)-methyltransferase
VTAPRGDRGSGEEQAIGGRRAVMEAARAGLAREILVADGAQRTQGYRELQEEARRSGVELRVVPRAALEDLHLRDHQGVAALLVPPRELDDRGLGELELSSEALVVVLDGVTDPQNLGAAARAAEAAGAAVLVARRRRAAPLSSAAIRASAGALLHLPTARVTNLQRAIEQLKDRGFTVIGLDQRADTTIHDAPPERPLAVVVGSEGIGLSRLVRESCDVLVSIPMPGRTASLNAAAALAVALFGYILRPP